MAQLFNRDIISFDKDDLLQRLRSTSLNNCSVENEIVQILEDMIEHLMHVSNESEFSLLLCTLMSGDELKLKKNHINATIPPKLDIQNITLLPTTCGNVSGLIGVNNATTAYSSFFWQEEDNVDIKNKAFSTYGLVSFLDVMLTTDISKSIFLGKNSGEMLDSCYVSGISGPITSSVIANSRVISYRDIVRTYHGATEPIDIAVKTLSTPQCKIFGTTIHVNSKKMDIKNMSSCTIGKGVVKSSDIGTKYVSNNNIIANNAITPTESNIASVNYVATTLFTKNAPKEGWRQSNVTREGTISSLEKTELIEAILGSNTVSQKNKPIVFADINYVLAEVGAQIKEMETCT
jgi:hypothetical protein